MHTIMVLAGGFALLAVCVLVGRLVATPSQGALAFIPLWLVAALVNMWIGVSRAGYSLAAELPIMLVVFAIPALAALAVRRYTRS